MHHVLSASEAGAMDFGNRVMSAAEAVSRFVQPGSTLGLGGQNVNRCPMALTHEIVRQRVGGLRVVGCNLSLPLDLLVAAGLVIRTEQGSGNLEKYGVMFAWRRAVERGDIEVRDYSHLTMASRFFASSMGLPFMPTRSLLGSDLLRDLEAAGDATVVTCPFTDRPIVLLRAMQPDVSIIHAPRADVEGNVVIDGVTSHEIEMVKASRHAIVTVEEVLPAGAFDRTPERVTISGAYVSAVVHVPFGAFPTAVYGMYDFAEPEIDSFQVGARESDAAVRAWIAEHIDSVGGFDEYLDRADPDGARRAELTTRMGTLR